MFIQPKSYVFDREDYNVQSQLYSPAMKKAIECIGLLQGRWMNSNNELIKTTIGTGVLIEKNVVLTCHHNIFNRELNTFCNSIQFVPNAYGWIVNDSIYQANLQAQTSECKGNYRFNRSEDLAVIRLDKPVKHYNVLLKIYPNPLELKNISSKKKAYVYGFRSKDFQKIKNIMNGIVSPRFCPAEITSVSDFHIKYKVDTVTGQSGAPILFSAAGAYHIIGIHTEFSIKYGGKGLFINNNVFGQIKTMVSELTGQTLGCFSTSVVSIAFSNEAPANSSEQQGTVINSDVSDSFFSHSSSNSNSSNYDKQIIRIMKQKNQMKINVKQYKIIDFTKHQQECLQMKKHLLILKLLKSKKLRNIAIIYQVIDFSNKNQLRFAYSYEKINNNFNFRTQTQFKKKMRSLSHNQKIQLIRNICQALLSLESLNIKCNQLSFTMFAFFENQFKMYDFSSCQILSISKLQIEDPKLQKQISNLHNFTQQSQQYELQMRYDQGSMEYNIDDDKEKEQISEEIGKHHFFQFKKLIRLLNEEESFDQIINDFKSMKMMMINSQLMEKTPTIQQFYQMFQEDTLKATKSRKISIEQNTNDQSITENDINSRRYISEVYQVQDKQQYHKAFYKKIEGQITQIYQQINEYIKCMTESQEILQLMSSFKQLSSNFDKNICRINSQYEKIQKPVQVDFKISKNQLQKQLFYESLKSKTVIAGKLLIQRSYSPRRMVNYQQIGTLISDRLVLACSHDLIINQDQNISINFFPFIVRQSNDAYPIKVKAYCYINTNQAKQSKKMNFALLLLQEAICQEKSMCIDLNWNQQKDGIQSIERGIIKFKPTYQYANMYGTPVSQFKNKKYHLIGINMGNLEGITFDAHSLKMICLMESILNKSNNIISKCKDTHPSFYRRYIKNLSFEEQKKSIKHVVLQ